MNGISKFGLAVAGSLAMATALAQAPTPAQQAQQAVRARQGVFEVIAMVFGPTGGMLRGAPFDAAKAAQAGERLQVLAPLISDAFARDTHGMPGLTTKARDAIWSSKSDFDSKANDLAKAAANLEAAAKTGDKAATLKAAGMVGRSCGACHDQFRDK